MENRFTGTRDKLNKYYSPREIFREMLEAEGEEARGIDLKKKR